MIYFFSGKTERADRKLVISIIQTNVCYTDAEKYPLECLFIVFFHLMSAYFSRKLVVFLPEHVRTFDLNALSILCFKR